MELWGRQYYSYDSDYTSDSCSDLDHAVCYEPELFIARRDIPTLRYGQRSERCDDERSECDVEFV